MIVTFKNLDSKQEIVAEYFTVNNENDQIQVLENHEDIIYVIKNGSIEINNKNFKIKNGILKVEKNDVSVTY